MNNIEILKDLNKYISFANKHENFSNDADYKWHKELAGMIENLIQENKELKEENHTLKEKLQMFIPRRRVRRVYKMLGKILRTDIDPILLEKELKQKDLEEGE